MHLACMVVEAEQEQLDKINSDLVKDLEHTPQKDQTVQNSAETVPRL
jgi:hypothetical protein